MEGQDRPPRCSEDCRSPRTTMIKPPVETHAATPVSAQSTGTHPAPGSRKTSSTEGLDYEYGGAGRSHMCRGLEEKELWLLKGLSTGRGQGLCGSLPSCPAIPTPWGMWSESWWLGTLAPVTSQKHWRMELRTLCIHHPTKCGWLAFCYHARHRRKWCSSVFKEKRTLER